MEKQYDYRDCSLYVFKYYAKKYHNENYDINELKTNVMYDDTGISLSNLKDMISSYGYSLTSYYCKISELKQLEKSEYPFGAIVKNKEFQHIVFIEDIEKEVVKYYDPSFGKIINLEIKDFKNIFLNIIVKFNKKTSPLEKYKEPKKIFNQNKYSYFLFFSLFLELLLNLTYPFVTKYILQSLVPTRQVNEFYYLIIFFVTFTAFSLLTSLIINKMIKIIVLKHFEKEFLNILETFPKENINLINNLSEIEIRQRINNIYQIEAYKITFIPRVLYILLSFLISLTLILITSYLLTLIMVIIGVLIGTFTFLYYLWYRKSTNFLISESISLDRSLNNYIKILKTNFLILEEEKFKKKIIKNFISHNSSFKSFLVSESYFDSINKFIDIIIPVLILFFGSLQIWNNKINLYQLLFFLTGTKMFLSPIKQIEPIIKEGQNFKLNKNMLNIFKKNEQKDKTLNFDDVGQIKQIKLSYVSYKYNKSQEKYSVNIPRLLLEGNNILKGNNGSGKTTLSSLLIGKYNVTNGDIFINNNLVNLYDNNFIKQRICYIGDNKNIPDSTLKEYLLIDDWENFKNILNKFQIYEAFKMLNIKIREDVLVKQLSSGQIQLVKFLKLLLYDYDVFIFDEAFEALSDEVFIFLKEKFSNLLRDKLTLEISHNSKYIFDDARIIKIEEITKFL
ncbi:Mbov_0121 family peptidase domain-containing ABC transporter [Mycoplasma sp. CSL7503-lung]|uniref:Mbov_0121 family peptidase domain-containing ABC transporter n=1 Tax=Mycoplasma sp. CSL7503-lung TaxID=536372 RepID=UPI0021D1DD94|nr:ATP-binding cassette domain-containing protein [Mycoplasma sp. CSL7503-lung]MCU4706852.1 ATP-binding cassette domain-containing protein [Mycoplasma sp. CSL7503-lung]